MSVKSGVVSEAIPAFGTHVYRLPASSCSNQQHAPYETMQNPSFEVSMGGSIPDGSFITLPEAPEGKARAAAFMDARDSVEGIHSLRLHTAADSQGLVFSSFPIQLDMSRPAEFSVWARGVATTCDDPGSSCAPPTLTIGLDFRSTQNHSATTMDVELGAEWKQFKVRVSAPLPPCHTSYEGGVCAYWTLATAGVAWLDKAAAVNVKSDDTAALPPCAGTTLWNGICVEDGKFPPHIDLKEAQAHPRPPPYLSRDGVLRPVNISIG